MLLSASGTLTRENIFSYVRLSGILRSLGTIETVLCYAVIITVHKYASIRRDVTVETRVRIETYNYVKTDNFSSVCGPEVFVYTVITEVFFFLI